MQMTFLTNLSTFLTLFSAASPNPFLKGSATRKSKTLSRNRDPGVESDEEDFEGELGDEDDMFRYNPGSHTGLNSGIYKQKNIG